MKRNNIAKLISKQQSSAGFTLIELLVASIIGVIIIGGAGFGLSQVLKASKDGNAAADRRAEVARAYDFISDEIRRAELVEPNLDPTNTNPTLNPTRDPNFTQTGTVVLSLKIPEIYNSFDDPDPLNNLDSDNDDTNDTRVVYYVSTPPPNSVWKGPRVLYRWGPPLNASGNYSPRSNANNANWVAQPLIDEISGNNITLNCEGATTPSTDDDWTASVAAGFGACIDPNNKTAQLYIDGDIKKALEQTDTYKSNTKTFARANQAANINLLNIAPPTSSLGGEFNCTGSGLCSLTTQIKVTENGNYPVDENNNEIEEEILVGGSSQTEIVKDREFTIAMYLTDNTKICSTATHCAKKNGTEVMSDNVPKSANGKPVSVELIIKNDKIYAASDTLTEIASNTGEVPGNDQVKIYYNGSVVPNDTSKIFDGQKTPYQFLKDKGVKFIEDTTTTPSTYKIDMNPNQVLIAFEMGQNSGTDVNDGINPGYDHQDNLVLLSSNDLNYPDP